MAPAHGRVESRCLKMLLEIEGQDMTRCRAVPLHGGLLKEVVVRVFSLLQVGKDRGGEPDARKGAT